MRVALSAYLLHEGADYRAAGVSTYVRQLLTHLPRVCPQHHYVAFHGPDAPPTPDVQSVVTRLPTYKPVVRIAWEQLSLPLAIQRYKPDVVHGTVNVVPFAPGPPRVVTVHDLAFMRHPERFPEAKRAYLRAAVSLSVRLAKHIIAVSDHTRRDLIDLLHVPPERVSVIYSGVDGSFHPLPMARRSQIRDSLFGGRPYLLHVGTLEPRKNIDLLIRAFAVVRDELNLPHVLALVGARGWMYHNLYSLVAELNQEDNIRFVDYVPPTELPLWYNGADLFAYPSAYEGFGLPVLEAMACGLPVITTANSGLQELVDGAGLTIPPHSQEALQVAIGRVLQDSHLGATLRQAGLHRARAFSWEQTARSTVQVYERLRTDHGVD